MKATGRWSVVSFIRFIVQFAWAVTLVTLFGQLLWLGVTLFISEIFHLPAPVFLSAQELNPMYEDLIREQGVAVYSSSVISANYVLSAPGGLSSIFISTMQLGLTAYLFYALTVLKRPLNALALDKVFEPENAIQLKTVALLALFAAPLKFFYQWFSSRQFDRMVDAEIIQTTIPPFDFTLLMAGLVLYIFAEIMKKAATIHEEQKLTV